MRMLSKATIVVILAAAGMSQAQDQQPISPFMRKTGILYLDQLDDFQRKCYAGVDACQAVVTDEMKRTLDSLQDNISIDLDEPGRPSGDNPYFSLLRSVRQAEYIYLSKVFGLEVDAETAGVSPEAKRYKAEQTARWNHVYASCYSTTREMAKTGSYSSSSAENCNKMIIESEGQDTLSLKQLCENIGALWQDGQCHAKAPQIPQIAPAQQTDPKPHPPTETLTGKEAEARSWHTEKYCKKHHFTWRDGVCHAKE